MPHSRSLLRSTFYHGMYGVEYTPSETPEGLLF